LIGHRCKCSDVCSRVVLIGRGLDGFYGSRYAVFKGQAYLAGPNNRILPLL
jgi:hypothetical protein